MRGSSFVSRAFFVALLASPSLSIAAGSMVADVTMNPMGDFKAKSNDVSGQATLAGDTVTADNIVVKLEKLDCGMPLRTRHAKEKYLDVKKYPEAVLSKATGKAGKGSGILTLHGISKPISGTYTIDGSTMKAEFPIKLSDYGIKDINYAGVGVEDEIKVHVAVPVIKK